MAKRAREVAHDFEYEQYGREVAAAHLDNGILTIPNGFLGVSTLHQLWVHPNYLVMDEYIRFRWQNFQEGRGHKNFHIVATPGIGKTFYGHYFFFHQAGQKRRVIWRTNGEEPQFLYYDFSKDNPLVYQSPYYVRMREWNMRDVWMIVDGGSTYIRHFGPIVQCASPDRKGYYYAFSKDEGFVCHLEAWSLEELQRCADDLKLGISHEDMELRFFYSGGIPRLAFDIEKFPIHKLRNEIHGAASRVSCWKRVIGCAASSGQDPQISDMLLHYHLSLDLSVPSCMRVEDIYLMFGSSFIEQLAFDKFDQQGFQSARDFFDFCQGIPMANVLAGRVFEKHVNRVISEGGGTFKYRSLEMDQVGNDLLILVPRVVMRLRKWKLLEDKQETQAGFYIYARDVSGADAHRKGAEEFSGLADLPVDCFVETYAPNQKSFDLLFFPDKIIQVTTSLDHSVYWSKVKEACDHFDAWHVKRSLDVPAEYKFIYVVPESIFGQYIYQGWNKDDGSQYQCRVEGMGRVKQYVMTIPWN